MLTPVITVLLLFLSPFLLAGTGLVFGLMYVYFSLRASAHFWFTPFSAIYHPAHLKYRSRALQSLFWCIGSFAAAFTLVLTFYSVLWAQNVTHADIYFSKVGLEYDEVLASRRWHPLYNVGFGCTYAIVSLPDGP